MVRLGIVGCGGISHAHAGAAAGTEDIRFVACCDVREDVAQEWAARYACESVYSDYEEMLRTERLDGVVLATWPRQHREQIERCLAAGARNILCEKSLALTGAEAVAIWQRVRTAGAFVMEGFMYRHHPAIRALEEILAAGDLGPVDHVRAAFSAYDAEDAPADDPTRDWRQRAECGGGVPYDFACYAVNACNHFAGAVPRRAFAAACLSENYGTVNRLYGLIEYDGGPVGIIESSKKADLSQELQIACARGRLTLPIAWTTYHDIDILDQRSCGWVEYDRRTRRVAQADAYQLQLANFAAAIAGGARPAVTLIESVVNTMTLDALLASGTEGRAVEIEIPDAIAEAMEQAKEN